MLLGLELSHESDNLVAIGNGFYVLRIQSQETSRINALDIFDQDDLAATMFDVVGKIAEGNQLLPPTVAEISESCVDMIIQRAQELTVAIVSVLGEGLALASSDQTPCQVPSQSQSEISPRRR